MLSKKLEKKLAKYDVDDLSRQRHVVEKIADNQVRINQAVCCNFTSNDYLGLSQVPVTEKMVNHYHGASTASAMVCGYQSIHQQLEHAFAEFFDVENTVLFTNGYMANLGIISALADQNTAVYVDKLSHASIYDGIALAQAKRFRYRHNELTHLSHFLTQHQQLEGLIISDALFSMNGDLADIQPLKALAAQYQALLMLDDAHGLGVLGARGLGSLEQVGLQTRDINIMVYPLGKALGAMGAIVAADPLILKAITQFSRSLIYSNYISPLQAAIALRNLNLLKQQSWRRGRLQELICYFKKQSKKFDLNFVETIGPIQILPLASKQQALRLQQYCLEQGFWVAAMRPPTVPANANCLRLSLNCLHREIDIDRLLTTLAEFNMVGRNEQFASYSH